MVGLHIVCDDRTDPGDYRAVKVDALEDFDGWRGAARAFVIDAESQDLVETDEVYAVVLPGKDPQTALAQFVAAVEGPSWFCSERCYTFALAGRGAYAPCPLIRPQPEDMTCPHCGYYVPC